MALIGLPLSAADDWYGHYGQLDLLTRSPRSNPLGEMRREKLLMSKGEAQVATANTELEILNVTGPGNVESMWMATAGPQPSLDARIRIYYDGSGTAAVDMDFGTLLAVHYGGFGPWHMTPHVKVQVHNPSYNTSWMITYAVPFGTSIRITYTSPITTSALTYWMVAYSLYAADRADGLRLRGAGVRLANQVTVSAAAASTRATITGGPGALIWHSYVGGYATATNLSWMERNFEFTVDGESTPSIISSGTEDWFDNGWYFDDIADFLSGPYSYVGTCTPVANPWAVGMATDLLAKWGGIPFTSSLTINLASETACTTGHTFADAFLYYQ